MFWIIYRSWGVSKIKTSTKICVKRVWNQRKHPYNHMLKYLQIYDQAAECQHLLKAERANGKEMPQGFYFAWPGRSEKSEPNICIFLSGWCTGD